MNKKSLVKFKYGEQMGLFHYVVYEGDVVVLSEDNTGKVKYVEKNNNLYITFDIETDNYDLLDVALVRDSEYVEKVYNYMIETNNPYFQDGFEHLVALKFSKK